MTGFLHNHLHLPFTAYATFFRPRVAAGGDPALLLENGDYLLLETGDRLLLE